MENSTSAHTLCVVKSFEGCRDSIYKHIAGLLESDYAVIYIAEPHACEVLSRLGRVLPDAEEYVESGALTLIEPEIFFCPSIESGMLYSQWEKVFETKKVSRFSGTIAVGMLAEEFFAESDHHTKVVNYESVLGGEIPKNVRFICCFLTDWLDKLSLAHLIAILDKHEGSLHHDLTISPLQRSILVGIIKKVIAKKLDANTAELIFDTFRLVYKLRENDIVAQPDKFVEKLGRLLGEPAAKLIIDTVKQELLESVSF